MMEYVLALISAIGLAVVFYYALSCYLEVRADSNRLLAVAQKQFAHSVNRLLDTPKDIPDEVLSMIRMMGETAFRRGTERILLKQIKRSRVGSSGNKATVAFDELRPELKELFTKATVAWLNIMTHKSTVGGLRISYAMSKVEAAAGEIPVVPAKNAFPAMREMAATDTPACAA